MHAPIETGADARIVLRSAHEDCASTAALPSDSKVKSVHWICRSIPRNMWYWPNPIYAYLNVYIDICIFTKTIICTYKHIYCIFLYLHMNQHLHIHTSICLYIYTYIYIDSYVPTVYKWQMYRYLDRYIYTFVSPPVDFQSFRTSIWMKGNWCWRLGDFIKCRARLRSATPGQLEWLMVKNNGGQGLSDG